MTERLYLCKGEMELCVDIKQPCPQHQLDAVRFLYRLFKLNKPGAILNDPSGYGKRVQVALFITAILPLLKSSSKPVLILCNEGYVEYWRKLLEERVTHNEISTNSTRLSKNVIYINPHKDGAILSRRQWGIVITDSEDVTKDRLILFKTDFKIWITNVDLKQNLLKFTSIYNWINPNNKFNMEDFEPKDNSLKEVVGKSLLFDAFLEDIVLRRHNFQALFDVSQKPKRVNNELPKKIVKNKDPTGTKVKRTKKRKIDDDPNNVFESSERDLKRHNTLTDDTVESMAVNETVENDNTISDHNISTEIRNEDNEITEISKDSHIIDFTMMDSEKDCTNDNIEEVQRTKEECNIETYNESLIVQNSDNEVNHNRNSDEIDKPKSIESGTHELLKNTLKVVQNCSDEVSIDKNSEHQQIDDFLKDSKNEIDELKCGENEIGESKNYKNITDTNKEVQKNGESSNKNKSVMSSLKEMEDKLLEYERKAAERYKGSFLDSII